MPSNKRKHHTSTFNQEKESKDVKKEDEIPVIKQVSPNVVPHLLEAVRAKKKFLSRRHQHRQKFAQRGDIIDGTNDLEPREVLASALKNRNTTQEAIFARMEASSAAAAVEQKSLSDPLHAYRQHSIDTNQSLLNAINQECTDLNFSQSVLKQKSASSSTFAILFDEENIPPNCATGCLHFLLGLLIEEANSTSVSKIILRHAAVCIIRELVNNRRDCFIIFARRNHMKEFVDAIGNTDIQSSVSDRNGDINSQGRPRKIGIKESTHEFQKEGLRLIHNLSDIVYGYPINSPSISMPTSLQSHFAASIIPTLEIARRYLEEQKGISLDGNSDSFMRKKSNGGMRELRRIRDMALTHAGKEVEKVDKILALVDRCFEVLVPRFGHGRGNSKFCLGKTNVGNVMNDKMKAPESGTEDEKTEDTDLLMIIDNEYDSDDDDVAWEDGEEENLDLGAEDESAEIRDATTESHLDAVERTLAVMKQSGTLQNDGTINVAFDSAHPKNRNISEEDGQHIEVARETLSKCVKKLFKHHERLSVWIDAIFSADNLTDASRIRSAALTSDANFPNHALAGRSFIGSVVILPEPIRKKKRSTSKTLIDAKNSVAKALVAAGKIGFTDTNDRENVVSEPEQPGSDSQCGSQRDSGFIGPWQVALGVKERRHFNDSKRRLNSALNQRRVRRKFGRGRLQIKLRKS